MSRLRHHMEHEKKGHERDERARGGSVEDGWEEYKGVDKPKSYTANDPDVEKEAEKRKRGGRTKRAHGGHVDGHKAKHRLDRPGRKRGGSVGADMHPLSSANKAKDATEHKATAGDATGED